MNTNKFIDKMRSIVIAVDGEAGSGKGTISKKLASNFNLFYCQTSVFYRKLAYLALKENVDSSEELVTLSKKTYLFDEIDEKEIYSESVTDKTSKIATIEEVREALKFLQKDILNKHSRVIMEGRDIGTVIAPNADIKLYIVADINKRAERRYLQYKKSGKEANLNVIKQQLIERDERDKNRDSAPLKPADDAIIVDNSDLGEFEFYYKVVEIIKDACD